MTLAAIIIIIIHFVQKYLVIKQNALPQTVVIGITNRVTHAPETCTDAVNNTV